MRSYVVGGAIVIGWALLAGVGVAVWLHYYPSRGDLTIYLTSVVPFAVLPAAAALILFAGLKRWIMVACTVIATLALGYTQLPLWVAQTAPQGEKLTVVTANLLFGRADIGALEKIVTDADADLLSLQEVTPEALERLRASRIAAMLSNEYAVTGPLAGGTAMYSRAPLGEKVDIQGTILRNLQARTDVPGHQGVRFLAIHPAAPLRGQSAGWKRDMNILERHLGELGEGPVIAAGDFNATWDQRRYRELLRAGFADATDQAGAGFLPTYPTDRYGGNRPLVALDRVMVRGFVATSVRTFYLPGSDHRTVVVSLVAS